MCTHPEEGRTRQLGHLYFAHETCLRLSNGPVLVPVSEQMMCNLWWLWLIVGALGGAFGMMVWAVLAMGSVKSREEEHE